jgi:hypothetical protein
MMLFCLAGLIVSDVLKDAMLLSSGSSNPRCHLNHLHAVYIYVNHTPEDSNI